MGPPPLVLEGVAHRFGRRWVLRGVHLTVERGEVVVLSGANGAGKTTLLRITSTLLRPLRGTGGVCGIGLLDAPERIRARIGLMGHSPALYEDLTADENLAFSLEMRRMPMSAEDRSGILDRVGLGEHARQRVRRFSAGMRRRVAVARILAAPPELLLMDEPYASLDRSGVELVNRMIGIVTAGGGGVLLATHDLRSGAALTDRVLNLEGGVVSAGRTGATA